MDISRIKELIEKGLARIEKYQDTHLLIVRKFDPATGTELAPDSHRLDLEQLAKQREQMAAQFAQMQAQLAGIDGLIVMLGDSP